MAPNSQLLVAKPVRLVRMIVAAVLMRLTVDTTTRMFYPFLPEISRGLGISLAQGGLLMSLRSSMIFLSPIFGAYTDRRGARNLLAVALIVQAGGLLWLSSATGFATAVPPILMLGLASSAFIPNLQAAVSERVAFERRGRVLGIIEFSWAITGLVILPIIGVVMTLQGWQAPLRVIALCSLAAAPLAFLLPSQRRPLAALRTGLRRSATVVLRSTSARGGIIVNGLMFVAAETFFVTYGAWMEQSFGMRPDQVGRIAAALGFAELIASTTSSLFIDRIGKRRGVGIGLVGMAVFMATLPLAGSLLPLAVAAMFLFTIFFEFSIVSNIGLMSEQVPTMRGTVLSLSAMASGVVRAGSATAGAALFEWRGITAATVFGVAGSLLAAFVLFRWVKERGDMPPAGEVASV
ncbi:MAG: MFS transporter [Anaerolineae bacterium]|nr:MFS transporter [Anaerolineae bacterium]MCB0254827.1 MFS transporter [Anaerolineae bacterium]